MSQIRSFLAIDLDDDFKPKVNKIIKEFKKIEGIWCSFASWFA